MMKSTRPFVAILERLAKIARPFAISAGLSFLLFCAPHQQVRAYPSFIGYGYTSCIVCHFNALGNGPLTDYGRALGATAISAKPFYSPKAGDQELGERAMFLLGAVKLPDLIRAQVSYRGMLYNTGVGTNDAKTRWLNMQLDGSVILKVAEDRLVAVINGGYQPAQGKGASGKPLSREHYVSYAVSPRLRLYAGLLDVAYGIRVPDHTAFSRKLNKVAQNDQVHGLMTHLGTNTSEFALHLFAGNLFQEANIRPKGVSFTFEKDVAEKIRVGASALVSASTVRSRKLFAIHTRAGVGKGSSILFESGFVLDSPKGEKTLTGNYLYTQTMTRLFRGFHFLFTGEYTTQDAFRPNPRTFRVGPSIQYFPTGWLETRIDFWGSRSIGTRSVVDKLDAYEILGQLHVWF